MYNNVENKQMNDVCIIEKSSGCISMYFSLGSVDISLKIDINNGLSPPGSYYRNESSIEYHSQVYNVQKDLLFNLASSSDASLCKKEYKMTEKTYLKCLMDCCAKIQDQNVTCLVRAIPGDVRLNEI